VVTVSRRTPRPPSSAISSKCLSPDVLLLMNNLRRVLGRGVPQIFFLFIRFEKWSHFLSFFVRSHIHQTAFAELAILLPCPRTSFLWPNFQHGLDFSTPYFHFFAATPQWSFREPDKTLSFNTFSRLYCFSSFLSGCFHHPFFSVRDEKIAVIPIN